jgi:3-hydroxy acid dehydrogenase/malonic semialdehyde reductase
LKVGDSKPDTIIVTGASSGIGLSICKKLLKEGYFVTGIARTIKPSQLEHENFTALACDLSDFEQTEKKIKALLKSDQTLSGVVFCAGSGYFGGLEQLDFGKIEALIELNLLSPMYLSKLLIPYFKRLGEGRLIFIGSEAALQGAKNGTAYCASKFGLRGFVQALSAECRQAGLNVSLINPGMVDTPFYENLYFRPGEDKTNRIPVQTIADCVYSLLHTDSNLVIDEINLTPRNRVVSFK